MTTNNHLMIKYLGHIGILFSVISMISGCAVIEPRLSPDQVKADAYAADPILPKAVSLAESLRVQYSDKVESQMLLDRAVGLTLIGAAGGVSGLASTAGPTTPIIATMIGGGALFGVDSFLSSKTQQLIYASGANAVQCSLDIMQPLIIAYSSRDRLATLLKGTDKVKGTDDVECPDDGSVKALQTKIADVEQLMTGSQRSPSYIRAETAVSKARSIIDPARKAIGVLDGSGSVLRSSLSSIELQVTNAIIENSPSIQSLAMSLGFSLPTIGKSISVPPVSPKPGEVKFTSSRYEACMLIRTQTLEQTVAEIESIIAQVNERPPLDKIKTCNINLEQSGMKMSILPSGDITITPPKGPTPSIITIRATGGILPYGAEWIGSTPPSDQVNFSVESGQGVVTVKVNKNAEEAAYGLLIHDAANGSANVNIRISSGANTPLKTSTQTPSNQELKTCTQEPTVRKIQDFLLKNGVKEVIISGAQKELIPDGCYGDITEAAIKKYLKEKILPEKDRLKDDEIPNNRDDLIKTITPYLDL